MLSYQHAYHAGGLTDVHKHSALASVLAAAKQADDTIAYFETHAGSGLYDLTTPEARKTKEADAGIIRLMAEDAPLPEPYLEVIRKVRKIHGPAAYPGSPLIARMMLRPHDPLTLFELHPKEHWGLTKTLAGEGVRIQKADGLTEVLRLLPAKRGTGMVFIDPSYEVKADYAAVGRFVTSVMQRAPKTRLLVWYPILTAGLHVNLISAVEASLGSRHIRNEVLFPPALSPRLRGSGLIGINLPAELGAEKFDSCLIQSENHA